jgi:hypothetical protein
VIAWGELAVRGESGVALRRVRRPRQQGATTEITAVFERGATQLAGMHRPSNAARLSPRLQALCDSERALPGRGHLEPATRAFRHVREVPAVERAASNCPSRLSPRRMPWILSFRIFDTPFAC